MLLKLMDEIAATLDDILGDTALGNEAFSISSRWNGNPSEPAIDVYPADPFRSQDEGGFQEVSGAMHFTVRARVAGDVEGRQNLLLRLMDDDDQLSVGLKLQDDQSLNGFASSVYVEGPSGYRWYVDDGGTTGAVLLGCEWQVEVLPVSDSIDAGGRSRMLRTGNLTLSASDILSFDGTAGTNVHAIDAPGNGRAIVVVEVVATLRAGATPFADGDDIYFGTFGTTGAIMEVVIRPSVMHQTSDQVSIMFAQQSSAVLTEFENAPVVAQNFGSPYTAGDGSLDLSFSYYIADL